MIVCVTARAKLREKAKKQTLAINLVTRRKKNGWCKINVHAIKQQPFGKKKRVPYCSKSSCTRGWKASSWHLKDDDSSLTFMETKDRRGFSSSVMTGAEL